MEKFQSRFKNDVYSDSKNDNQIWCVFFSAYVIPVCCHFKYRLRSGSRALQSRHSLALTAYSILNSWKRTFHVILRAFSFATTYTHSSVISEANNIIETRSAFNLFRVQAIESLMCWNGLASGRIGTFYTDSGKVKCHSIGIIWNQNCIHTGSCRHGVKYHHSRM